jgi:23S rRNA (cytosine1962-C5)-methyltransferase
VSAKPPWVLHEDDDVLAVMKPHGVNTHRPDAHAQEGMYEAVLGARATNEAVGLMHRLDKETSGALLLGKTPRANRALTEQLSSRALDKRYLLLVARSDTRPARLVCDDKIKKPRRGAPEQDAETEFERLARGPAWDLMEARPRTGRTHQVRVHAARLGMPILGDGTYGGATAARLCLHAARVRLEHPAGTGPLEIIAPPPEAFAAILEGASPHAPLTAARCALEARTWLVDVRETDAFLWIDRHHDGFADVRVEKLGSTALVIRYDERSERLPHATLAALLEAAGVGAGATLTAVWEQRRPKKGTGGPATRLHGDAAAAFTVKELGLSYALDLGASPTSTGLFLDQRETRRRLLGMDLRGKACLNGFSHTGALSVAAARAGAVTTSLDLSKRYLDWGRENLRLNGLDPAAHDFIYGDALDWLRRLEKKGRRFDLVLLDPPSFSTTGKGKKTWSAERDLGTLVAQGARLTSAGGTLFVSTNLRRLPVARFLDLVAEGLRESGRAAKEVMLTTLPLDHRSGPQDPPYLKAAWISV